MSRTSKLTRFERPGFQQGRHTATDTPARSKAYREQVLALARTFVRPGAHVRNVRYFPAEHMIRVKVERFGRLMGDILIKPSDDFATLTVTEVNAS